MGSGDGADLLQAHVEELLQHDGGALLRRESLHQRDAHVARGARRRRVAARLGRARGERRGLQHAATHGVDPQVGRGAQQVRARILDPVVDVAERAEAAQQRVLHQVLGVPEIAGEAAAIAVEGWPQRRRQVDVAVPGAADVVLHRGRECGYGSAVRLGFGHGTSSRVA